MDHPLFKFLSAQVKTPIEWNFWKFIVRPYGNVRKGYQHWVKPLEFEPFLEQYMLEMFRAGELWTVWINTDIRLYLTFIFKIDEIYWMKSLASWRL